jgi:hypothetical protein
VLAGTVLGAQAPAAGSLDGSAADPRAFTPYAVAVRGRVAELWSAAGRLGVHTVCPVGVTDCRVDFASRISGATLLVVQSETDAFPARVLRVDDRTGAVSDYMTGVHHVEQFTVFPDGNGWFLDRSGFVFWVAPGPVVQVPGGPAGPNTWGYTALPDGRLAYLGADASDRPIVSVLGSGTSALLPDERTWWRSVQASPDGRTVLVRVAWENVQRTATVDVDTGTVTVLPSPGEQSCFAGDGTVVAGQWALPYAEGGTLPGGLVRMAKDGTGVVAYGTRVFAPTTQDALACRYDGRAMVLDGSGDVFVVRPDGSAPRLGLGYRQVVAVQP